MNIPLAGRAAGWMRRLSRRHRLMVISVAAVGLLAVGGTAIATTGDPYPGVVTVYTGCLNQTGNGSGTIVSLQANATTPLKPCGSNQTAVHVAGGTITAVTPGAGLSGGGTNGAATLSLSGNYQLPQSCSPGDLPGSNGGASGYSCYSAGTGLNSDSGTHKLLLDGPFRLPQGCSDGSVPGSGSSGLSWNCYAAGTGLTSDTSSKTLHLAGPYQLPQGCPAGQVPGSTGPGNNYACYAPGTGLSSDTTSKTVGVNVGTGLSTDASNNLGVAGSYQLPQSCITAQIAKWDGSAWQCANDNPTGLHDVYTRRAFISVTQSQVGGAVGTLTNCDPGDVAIAGGVGLVSLEGSIKLSNPIGDPPTGWQAQENITAFDAGNDHNFLVYVVCAKTG
jgi:hypothetical protein